MSTDEKRIRSDLAKVDAHVITPEEYEEAPELTEQDLDRAEIRIGDKLIREANPPLKIGLDPADKAAER